MSFRVVGRQLGRVAGARGAHKHPTEPLPLPAREDSSESPGPRAAVTPVIEAYLRLRSELFDIAIALRPDHSVSVQTDIGPLWLHTEDRVMTPWITHYRSWEPDEGAFMRSVLQPGMIVLDVGANVGYSSLLCAQAVGGSGWVIAIEPDPANHALLCANVWNNAIRNVIPLKAAATSTTHNVPLSRSADNFGDHRAFARAQASEIIEVPGIRLDDVLRPDVRVDFIKIDIQGTDHRAIIGLEQTIGRWHPQILVEFWPVGIEEAGERPLDVLAYYRSLGLSIALLDAPTVPRSAETDVDLVAEIATADPAFSALVLRVIDRTG